MNEVNQYRPSLTFYHSNAKGTGSACAFQLYPAHDNVDGCIMCKVANQLTVGDSRGPNPTFPRFDWENAVVVKLCFDDLCKMLQVFRGECESIDDGRGLYHISAKASTKIQLSHVIEPTCGYWFEVNQHSKVTDEDARCRILFSSAESLGLCEAITGSMSVVSFGIPMVCAVAK